MTFKEPSKEENSSNWSQLLKKSGNYSAWVKQYQSESLSRFNEQISMS